MPIGSIVSTEVEEMSSSDSEEKKSGEGEKNMKLVEIVQLSKGKSTVVAGGLGCIILRLYYWTDDGKFARCLEEHPHFSCDVVAILYTN